MRNSVSYGIVPILAFLGLSVCNQYASASSDFTDSWLAVDTTVNSYQSSVGQHIVTSSVTSKPSDRPDLALERDEVYSSFVSAPTAFGNVSIASNYSDHEYSSAFSAEMGAFQLTSTLGRGEAYAKTQNTYSGMDPYLFHGGNYSDFRYSGHSLAYGFGNGHALQFGQTKVEADRLDDRRASFVDYSNNRLFARFTQVDRGSDKVGYGVDMGINVGRFDIAYQALSSRYDVSTERVALQWNRDVKNKFSLTFTQHDNALLASNSDTSTMISWQHSFGAGPLFSRASEEQPKKKKSKGRRGILIGGAAAAAALLISSGSSDQDSSDRTQPDGNTFAANIQAQHDTARARLNNINPRSVRENREFGGYIFQAADGSYGSTIPVRGEAASVTLLIPRLAVPAGTMATASYHTHAAFDPRFDNENFSPTDLEGDRQFNLDGYLGTPGGAFKYHEVSTGRIQTLGTIDN